MVARVKPSDRQVIVASRPRRVTVHVTARVMAKLNFSEALFLSPCMAMRLGSGDLALTHEVRFGNILERQKQQRQGSSPLQE